MCLLSSVFVTVLAKELLGKKPDTEGIHCDVAVQIFSVSKIGSLGWQHTESHSKHDCRVTCTENS